MKRIILGSAVLVALTVMAPRGAAAANFGLLIGSADLDGDGTIEDVYNNLSSINVANGNTLSRSYSIGFTSWALLFGNFSSVQDLDGVPGAEVPVNIGGSLLIIHHASRSTVTHPISPTTWAPVPGGIIDLDGQPGKEVVLITPTGMKLVQERTRNVQSVSISGQFAVIGDAIADLDGTAGAEIPVANGAGLQIYSMVRGVLSSFPFSGNWAVCTSGSACVSDMDGTAGAELLIAVPNAIQILRYRSGVVNSFPIGQQYAVLSDGVRDFDGSAGNDIAIARADGNLLILRPQVGVLQSINGAGTFGSSWTLVGYINADGQPGDELRLRSTANNRIYRVNPRSGTVSAE
ncbi:MAG: hypothetical protein H7138_18970 [Myxococcales bacterium]|nr:hypothetical protein [Myxococcales bacterium]